MQEERGAFFKDLCSEREPRGRSAAQEGRELGTRIFYPGRERLEHVVSQGLGARPQHGGKTAHSQAEEAGSVCLGAAREGPTVARFFLCHAPQWY